MPKKRYDFNYDFHKAEVSFEVDLEKFTHEMAMETLEFFSMDYNYDADPIDEVMKKYAMAALRYALVYGVWNTDYLRADFNQEGFGSIDGSIGIMLVHIEPFKEDLYDDDLEMEVKDA